MENTQALGIDFGTCYTCVGFIEKNQVFSVLPISGERKSLNYVAFKQNLREIGETCRTRIRTNINCTLYDSKLLLGKEFSDVSLDIHKNKWPFRVINGKKNRVEFQCGDDKIFPPEHVISMFFQRLKEYLENISKKQLNLNVVITVPASYSSSQRQALIDAAEISGLNVLRLLNDTTSAAIGYVYDKNLNNNKNVFIFDLGANYLNISIVSIVEKAIYVRSSRSIPNTGGQIIDFILLEYFAKQIISKLNFNIFNDKKALQSLIINCEKLKKTLSNSTEAHIEIESLVNNEDFSDDLDRDNFDSLTSEIFESIFNHVREMLEYSNMSQNDIDDVLLIGGCSRIPKIKFLLEKMFNEKKLNQTMNASETVSYGASVLAHFISTNRFGFEYYDICTNNYLMRINLNSLYETDLTIEYGSGLPAQKSFYLRKLAPNWNLNIELFENNQRIFKAELNGNFNSIELILFVDLNGLVNIRANKMTGEAPNVTAESDILIKNKMLCLDPDEKESIRVSNENFIKQREQILEKQNNKNSLEKECYFLKNVLSKEQNKEKFTDLLNKLDQFLTSLRANKINDLDAATNDLESLKKEWNSIKTKAEMNVKTENKPEPVKASNENNFEIIKEKISKMKSNKYFYEIYSEKVHEIETRTIQLEKRFNSNPISTEDSKSFDNLNQDANLLFALNNLSESKAEVKLNSQFLIDTIKDLILRWFKSNKIVEVFFLRTFVACDDKSNYETRYDEYDKPFSALINPTVTRENLKQIVEDLKKSLYSTVMEKANAGLSLRDIEFLSNLLENLN